MKRRMTFERIRAPVPARAEASVERPTRASVDRRTGASAINAHFWKTHNRVPEYATRVLRPVEIVVIARYHQALSGRVLEAGCGAGRVLGYLAAVGREVHGIDISPAMVDYCRHTYPQANVRLGDLGALTESVEGPFDAVVAADNVLDVFEDADRRRVLAEMRTVLTPDGILIFSSHNLAYADGELDATGPQPKTARRLLAKLAQASPAGLARVAVRTPKRVRNRLRLVPLQHRADDHAILNDVGGNYAVLHYYIGRDEQERQLNEAGLRLVECLDVQGRLVPSGEVGYGPWLHYIARPITLTPSSSHPERTTRRRVDFPTFRIGVPIR